MKIGDKVLYVNYNVYSYFSGSRVAIGYVFYIDDKRVGIAKHNNDNAYPLWLTWDKMINKESLTPFGQESLKDIVEKVENVIKEESNKIKSLTSEEKNELKRKEFDRIRIQIINTAKNMVIEEDGDGFVDCLKAICQLKKQMFSIKISDLHNIHKINGEIKYRIKQLQKVVEELNNIEVNKENHR